MAKVKTCDSGGIETNASEQTGALNRSATLSAISTGSQVIGLKGCTMCDLHDR